MYGLVLSCTCNAETVDMTTDTRPVALKIGTRIARVIYVSAVLHFEDFHDTFAVAGVTLFPLEEDVKLNENFLYLNVSKRCKAMIVLRASLSR